MKTDDSLNLENAPQEALPEGARATAEPDAAVALPAAAPSENGLVQADQQEEVSAETEEKAAEHGTTPEGKTRNRSILRELIETVVIVLVVFLVVRALIQNFVVEGDSMLPTLHSDQYLLVNKVAYFQYDANFLGRLFNPGAPPDTHYLFGGPSRGDIVVFISPTESKDLIKRVIAVAGETVEVRPDPDPTGRPGSPCGDCGVYVNGVRLNEPYIKATPDYRVDPLTVPEGHVYVLGDNRRNSQDSHAFGPLAIERIVGVAFFSYWPLNGFGFLPHSTYQAPAQP
ncbi:MAG: signal peptidase I [Chloroflexia bacterium]